MRFAPSPTGHFHLGNLRTAWISERWARFLNVPWVVRFEDIDRPRIAYGAREEQNSDLLTLGLHPDVELDQSEFLPRHFEVFQKARALQMTYPCDCSRKEVQMALTGFASAPHIHPPNYSGHCRDLDPNRTLKNPQSVAWRFRMPDATGCDDFVIARGALHPSVTDFSPAYHWACAIDDFDGDCDLLVRAHDLQPAAFLQQAVQKWLGEVENRVAIPAVFHTSLVVQEDGHRLEKRTAGASLKDVGVGADEVVRLFARSFDTGLLRRDFAQAEHFGELKSSVSMRELGL